MKIEILGTGCFKCIQLETLVNEVIRDSGRTDIQVARISDEREIRRYMPLDEIPGLVIDGALFTSVDVLSRDVLVSWLKRANQPVE